MAVKKAEEATKLGASGFLAKPFKAGDIITQIKETTPFKYQ